MKTTAAKGKALAMQVAETMADRSGDERWTKLSVESLLRWIDGDSVVEAVALLESQGVEPQHVGDCDGFIHPRDMPEGY